MQYSSPTFAASYAGPAIAGLDISSIISSLTFIVTPSISGPGVCTITAAGTAPAGFALNIAPATLTIVGSTSATLPTVAPTIMPFLPPLLPSLDGNEAASLTQPLNSVGFFQVEVKDSSDAYGTSFLGFGLQEKPLAQAAFFGTDHKKETYSAGAKP